MEPPGKTTRGFLPGPIRPGRWAAELGVAAVIPQSDGDADGKVGWRVEIDFADDPAFADEPYKPARYDSRPVRRKPGWYSGDFHVHAEHSAYGNATMTEQLQLRLQPGRPGRRRDWTSSRCRTTCRAAPGARSGATSRATPTT